MAFNQQRKEMESLKPFFLLMESWLNINVKPSIHWSCVSLGRVCIQFCKYWQVIFYNILQRNIQSNSWISIKSIATSLDNHLLHYEKRMSDKHIIYLFKDMHVDNSIDKLIIFIKISWHMEFVKSYCMPVRASYLTCSLKK
jgi:hypothetical protein